MQAPEDAALVARLRAAGCVFAEDEARLLLETATDDEHLASMLERRVAGEPLEFVLGWAEFCGLRIDVDAGVFRPRPRSEPLVRHAATLGPAGAVVVDLCCGSGALGVALVTLLGGGELHACDVDPAAVACATRNAERVGGRVYQGDLFEPLPRELRGRVDVLLANVPYVPSEDMAFLPAEARLHEPAHALDGGADGLDVLRRVSAETSSWLAPGGHLLTESGAAQAAPAAEILRGAGLGTDIAAYDDVGATVVVGARPADVLRGQT